MKNYFFLLFEATFIPIFIASENISTIIYTIF